MVSDKMPSHAISAGDKYEEKIRRKLASENRSTSMPTISTSAAESFEERLKRKLLYGEKSHHPTNLSSSLLDSKAYEEKIRGKLESENANSAGDEYEEKIGRKLARENRSASMTTSSTSAAKSAFEERLKRKLDGGKGNHAKNLSSSMVDLKAYEETIRWKVERESDDRNLTSSMPANSMSISRDILNEQMGQKRENDHSMKQGCILEDDVDKTDLVAIEQESYLEVSNVCFNDLFTDLQRFKEENGNLLIPVSHHSFTHIMDNFLSSGMEELLKKRWDYQLAGLKAFKREHGDCLVPVSHPTLGQWTRIQIDHYKRYEQRLPSPLTKKRFDKLSKIGFDKFVSWEESNKNGGNLLQKEQRKSAETVEQDDDTASGDESEAIISDNLTLDQKIQMKKMGIKVKFMERGLKTHSSSKERRPDKEAVTAELYEKRMLQRSVRRGVGRSYSKIVITETIEKDKVSDGIDVCNVPNNDRKHSLNKSTSIRLAGIAPTSASTSRDDINIESWSELCDVLTGVATESGTETIEKNTESDFSDVCNVLNSERRNSFNKSTSIRLADIAPTSASTSRDGINVESWSELCDVLAGVTTQSISEASLI